MALLTKKKVPVSALMTAVSLLREIESVAPMQLYIDRIVALEAPDEKGDMYAESLLAMGTVAVEPMIAALSACGETGRDIFADILSNYPGDERIFDLLMERFNKCDDRVALFAHQGFGLAFLSCVLDIPYPLMSTRFDMSHTGMTVIEFQQSEDFCLPRILSLANDSHLYREGLPTKYNNRLYF